MLILFRLKWGSQTTLYTKFEHKRDDMRVFLCRVVLMLPPSLICLKPGTDNLFSLFPSHSDIFLDILVCLPFVPIPSVLLPIYLPGILARPTTRGWRKVSWTPFLICPETSLATMPGYDSDVHECLLWICCFSFFPPLHFIMTDWF